MKSSRVFLVGVLLLAATAACGWWRAKDRTAPPQMTYDKTTGKLTRIAADLNKDGKYDTWTYMDGTVPLRAEQDLDEDGKIDRWEYYGPDGKITKVALSLGKTGRQDTWVYPEAAGARRVLYSHTSDEAKIFRWEHYDATKLVRVEQDTDGDGRPHQWEVHDGPSIVTAEFDTNHDGKPDKRLTFDSGGRVLSTETQPDGRGGYRVKQLAGTTAAPSK